VARVVAPVVVVAAIVILAIGAVAQIGPASGPDRRIVDRSFAELAGPIVADSNESGSALRALLGDGPTLKRTTFFSDVDEIATAAAVDDREFAGLSPPQPGGDAAGKCGATMAGRQEATARIGNALEDLLGGRRGVGGGDEATAARALEGAGGVLEAADASWVDCRRSLRRAPGGARLPASVWVADPGVWSGSSVGQFVAALVSSGSLAAVHSLTLIAITTDPASVPGPPGVAVVPPVSALRVMVVLVDQGNIDEEGVRLVVSAAPLGTVRTPAPVRARADVDIGESVTVSPPALSVRPGASYVIHVTARAETGARASTSMAVQVSATPPTSTTTTTTTTATTTTTTSTKGTSTTKGSG
jgi:hypothetical protein